MTLWGQITKSREHKPPAEPVSLKVQEDSLDSNLASASPTLTEGIRALYQKCHFYDVFLVGGGSRFPAHQAVLAALSPKLRDLLCEMREKAAQTAESAAEAGAAEQQQAEASNKNPELILPEISSPEALRALLDFVYGLDEYHVTNEAANGDVLRLARQFDLQFLEQCAARWLSKGLTVANVISRLVTCEEFGLSDLSEKIKEKVTMDSQLLIEVTKQGEAAKHPEILQSLLMRVAMRSATAAAAPAEPAAKTPAPEKREAPAAAEAPPQKKAKAAARKK